MLHVFITYQYVKLFFRYEYGRVFETSDCQECECVVGGDTECIKKECPPCQDVSVNTSLLALLSSFNFEGCVCTANKYINSTDMY